MISLVLSLNTLPGMFSPNKRTFLTYKRHKLNSQVNRTPSINNITLPSLPQVNRLTKRNSELLQLYDSFPGTWVYSANQAI